MPAADLKYLVANIEMARERLAYGLERTPDEQLNRRPSETAKSPLEVAGRAAVFAGFMAHVVAERAMPDRSGGLPPAPETRAQAIAAVDGAMHRLAQVVTGLSDTDLEQPVPVPWGGTMSVAQMLWFGAGVLGYWQGQLNYVQTLYGDMDPNIPPSWIRKG